LIRAIIEIVIPDIERVLEWYHIYKNDHKSTSEDVDVVTKLTAMLITAKKEESERYHYISSKYPRR
jgi:hypothetical protein